VNTKNLFVMKPGSGAPEQNSGCWVGGGKKGVMETPSRERFATDGKVRTTTRNSIVLLKYEREGGAWK